MRYAVQAVQPGTAMTAKVAASGETPGLFIFLQQVKCRALAFGIDGRI